MADSIRITDMIQKFGDLPRGNRWLAHFDGGPSGIGSNDLKESLYYCQSVDIPGRTMMTKETFNLTQPASYAYGTTIGDLSMTFLVSAGTLGAPGGQGNKTSTYETFYAWMDSIVSMGQANISYADDHVCDIRLKLIDQEKFTHANWQSGGSGILKGEGEHVSLLATRAWPSAIGNLSFTMEEGVMTFSVTFKIHKLLESNTDIASASINQALGSAATKLGEVQNDPSQSVLNALSQANATGRAAVGAFDKISKAIQADAAKRALETSSSVDKNP